MELIGQNIKNFRTKRGFTQDQVAEYLGINNREVIAMYENGTRSIPLDLLEKISDLFGIDLDVLLEEDADQNVIDTQFAFRTDGLNNDDLTHLASFQRLVKNYIKMKTLINE